MQFVGFADVQINDSKYSFVRIIETVQTNEAFGTIVLLQTHDGKWDYIEEDVDKVSSEYFVKYK
jgi:hypothetical protein